MCQLFIWKFKGDDKIKTFTMTRLPMGNSPSTNISITAVKETTKLEDFKTRYLMAHHALNENSYVDNVFHGVNAMEKLTDSIKEIRLVAAKGGFQFKDWIVSYQQAPHQVIGIMLPDVIDPNVEKTLGLFLDIKQDELYVSPSFKTEDKSFLQCHVEVKSSV